MGASRVYYFIKTDEVNGPVRPFPPGLRMISGVQSGRNASAYEALGLAMSCAGNGARISYLANSTSHPGGCNAYSLGIFFPSCGLASGAIDSEDHL
jgi:hypothetical protein